MVTKAVFGRTHDFRFCPQAGDESIPAKDLESARLYADAPTAGQRAGTEAGYLESVTQWVEKTPGEYSILIPPQEDPDSESSEDFESYYLVVRCTLEEGGPVQVFEEIVHYWRADALTSKVRVLPEHIYARESRIKIVAKPTFLDRKIENAIIEIDRVLRARGYHRKRTFNREKMQEAVELLTTSDACFDLAGEGNEFWMEKGKMWRERYIEARDAIPLGYDVKGDDKPGPEDQVFSGAVALER